VARGGGGGKATEGVAPQRGRDADGADAKGERGRRVRVVWVWLQEAKQADDLAEAAHRLGHAVVLERLQDKRELGTRVIGDEQVLVAHAIASRRRATWGRREDGGPLLDAALRRLGLGDLGAAKAGAVVVEHGSGGGGEVSVVSARELGAEHANGAHVGWRDAGGDEATHGAGEVGVGHALVEVSG